MSRIGIALAAALLLGAASSLYPWSAGDLAVLQGLSINGLGAPPPDPSNRFADDPAAASLGEALFFDRRLSANGRVACSTCHEPRQGFTDRRRVGRGLSNGARRTMPIAPAVYSTWQFWDGRADSLWAQALGPIENPAEHGFTRTEAVRLLATRYRDQYAATFGPLPDMSDPERFPARASPLGDAAARAAWDRMTPADQARIDVAFARFGKALAAYERTLRLRPTRFDAYVAALSGDASERVVFSAEEVAGLQIFIGQGRCVQCHNGPLLTNEGFANTGVPSPRGQAPDLGRTTGIRTALADPFNCRGFFSDAENGQCEELDYALVDSPEQRRAFKAPSLRGVAQRAPYMHSGQFATLDAVIDHYNRAPPSRDGTSGIEPLHLSRLQRRQLVAFLRTLNDPPDDPRPSGGTPGRSAADRP
ncbi:cytochrome c peroxidase [Brevundimonas sp.]|uniref:cytochrome-c peroxidase n=1 Tax=Brevundimonas sp. TaxID=1871086 RepID=UPI00286AE6F0|nr:cytochrome c peroxidase [Brevundimonas sp.]